MALPLPTDDAELFAELLASLQTDDAHVEAVETIVEAPADVIVAIPATEAEAEAPSGRSAIVDAPDASLELLDGDAAELLDALYEPVLALDDCFAVVAEDQAAGSGGGQDASAQGVSPPAPASSTEADKDKPRARRRTRRANPNKAREEQRRELVALRSQAVEMERQVRALQARSASRLLTTSSDTTAADKDMETKLPDGSDASNQTMIGVKLMDVWRQTCLQQIQRRVQAERENTRLKRALASQLEMASAIQSILQKPTVDSDATDALKRRRTELADTPPADPVINMEVFAQLIGETDASIEKIVPFLEVNGLLGVDAHRRGTHVRELSGGVVLDVFSTSLLPYDWHFASRGIWNFYRGSQKHHGPVFGKTAQKIGPSEDTVLESFTMEIAAGDVRADFRIRQVVKRYVQDQQQIIAWTLFSHPTELSNKSVNFGFRENGFVVCRPPRTTAYEDTDAPPPVTVMQVGYRISPYMSGPPGQQLNLRANINDIAKFMFTSLNEELRAKIERIENLLLDERRKA